MQALDKFCQHVRLHSLCIPQGRGADDFEGGSQFFWKGTRGDVEIFYNRKGGGCQFFYLILVYNEKAMVIVFFF